MANRIKFEFLNGLRKTEIELLGISQKVVPEATPTDCYITNTFGLITYCNKTNIDLFLQEEIIKELNKHNLKPKPHQTYYIDRTIFAGNIRPFATHFSAQELINSINNDNPGIQAESVFTLSTYNSYRFTMKITFKNTFHVEKVLVEGIRIKGMWIEPEFIHREKLEEIIQCFRCFDYSHPTNKCKSETAFCSICAETHHFSKCPHKGNKEKTKCKNCNGNHIAIAKSCPKRKEAIQENNSNAHQKQQQQNQQSTTSHTTQQATAINNQFPQLTKRPLLQNNGQINHNFWQQRQQQQQPALQQQNIQQQLQQVPQQSQTPLSQHQTPLPQQHQNHSNSNNNQSTSNQFKEHEWEIKLSLTKAYAEIVSLGKGDGEKYLQVVNNFLEDVGLTSLNISINKNNNPPTESQQASPPQSSTQSSPSLDLPPLTPVSQLSQLLSPLTRTDATTPIHINTNTTPTHSTPESQNRTIVTTQPQLENTPNTSPRQPDSSPLDNTANTSASTANSPNLRISTSAEFSSSEEDYVSNSERYETETDTDADPPSYTPIPCNQVSVRPKTRNQTSQPKNGAKKKRKVK